MPGKYFIDIKAEPPFKTMAGRFTRAGKQLKEQQVKESKALSGRFLRFVQEEAPGKEFPQQLQAKTYVHGSEAGFRVYGPEPLTAWIIMGTRPHVIKAKGSVLAFEWERGPAGPGRYFFPRVNHPGTKANPFHLKAMERFEAEVPPYFQRVFKRFSATMQGQGGV